ncbi:MAG: hypothetical protein J2P45_29110, partial [Candidatus Dormibacteraeota bacterium]|nr:hypothetical protein [Candidatus Dormibacteraeota bacterium]
GSGVGTSGSLSSVHLPAPVKALVLQQVTKGYNDTFWIAAGIVLLGFPLSLLLRRAPRPGDVRAYGRRTLGQGIVLGAAALWVRRNPDALNGHSPLAPAPMFAALARGAQERLRTGMTVMRLGTNAAGLLPQDPLPVWLWALVALGGAAALAGLAFCFAQGLHTPTPPPLPVPHIP